MKLWGHCHASIPGFHGCAPSESHPKTTQENRCERKITNFPETRFSWIISCKTCFGAILIFRVFTRFLAGSLVSILTLLVAIWTLLPPQIQEILCSERRFKNARRWGPNFRGSRWLNFVHFSGKFKSSGLCNVICCALRELVDFLCSIMIITVQDKLLWSIRKLT